MDSTAPRAFVVLEPLLVTITNLNDEYVEHFGVDRHPKNDIGQRRISFGKKLYIDRSDFVDTDSPEEKQQPVSMNEFDCVTRILS